MSTILLRNAFCHILAGENLHRRAVYEPNILQKFHLLACTKGRAAVVATIGCLFLLVIALIVALSSGKSCDGTVSSLGNKADTPTKPAEQTPDYISTNGKPFPYQDIRLPKSVIPNHYQILLHPNISRSFFNGKIKIYCDVKYSTDFIVFHLKTLNITSLQLQDVKTLKQIEVLEWLEYTANEQIFVKLGSRLEAGSKVILDVRFQGDLIKKLAGFYKSSYKTNSGEQRYSF